MIRNHFMKKVLLGTAAASLLLASAAMQSGSMPAASAAAAKTAASPAILLDGYKLSFPAPPVVKAGTTMVPFRAIAEALHITVNWNAQTQTVTAKKGLVGGGFRKVVLKQGSMVAQVDGKSVTLAAAPYMQNGSVLVPLSFFSSQFGAVVSWNGATRTVSIKSTGESDPNSTGVLINKQFGLPASYEPSDLVYPDVAFTFSEKIEKRKMRKVAADALKTMFAGAKQDGIYLAGVSGYRSYERQKAIFESYVKRDGEAKARTYSAYPGYSEHETGLAIDISGSTGKCAAEDCFAGTPEAKWIAKHAAEYGFIVRYPNGKEKITGYKYEPWHIRYVGKYIAGEIAKRDITLEEYYNAVPVSK